MGRAMSWSLPWYSGGVLPNIHSVLLPKGKGKKGEAGASLSQEF
jgi:hypothetical protein